MSLVRRAFVTSALVCGALFAAGPAAIAQPAPQSFAADQDCSDFTYQEDAQAVYDADPSDPNNLDGKDNDGIACESLPHRPATPVTTTPVTDTPDTGAAAAPAESSRTNTTTSTKTPQVKVKPVGGVATGGDGVADATGSGTLTALGGLVLLAIAAGTILAVRRRAGR